MTSQTEIRIKAHFKTNDILIVDLVDNEGNNTEHTFLNYHEALRDIPNIECEYDIYF